VTDKLIILDPESRFDGAELEGDFTLEHVTCLDDLPSDVELLLWCQRGNQEALTSLLSARSKAPPAVVVLDDDAVSMSQTLYAAGVLDILSWQQTDTLPERLARAKNLQKTRVDLLQRATRANEMAFSAMANTADLGACLQFFMKSVECENFESLGALFFETMNHFNIRCVLQIRSDFGVRNLAPRGEPGRYEILLLDHLKDRGRFFDYQQRTFVNYESISLLIKDMPVDDPVKYGQIKDNILTVVEAVDMKTRELDNYQALCNEKELMQRIVQRVQAMVKGVDDSFNKVIKDIASVVENMVQSTEEIIPQLMMSEEQERSIEAIMQRGISDTQRVFSDGLKVDEGFRDFLEELARVTSQQSISHAEMASLLKRLRD
jgi:hypothetical protein